MTFTLMCGDVMPGCTARFESSDHDDLMTRVGAHASTHHQVRELTPDLVQLVSSHVAISA